MSNLTTLLHEMIHQGASDLHITSDSAPQLRIDGHLVPIEGEKILTPEESKNLCFELLTEEQKNRFEKEHELDFSFAIENVSRFRANIYMQKDSLAAAYRTIPFQIPPLEKLGLPPVIYDIIHKPRGLVLVTGPTGSGKSTTLASMLDVINETRHDHIVTIEDPIEFVHTHKKCFVSQREIGKDSQTFTHALKYVLRQDPDVILVGEMRDLETISAAITISETGHMVFATLHTNNAVQTINRVIDVFSPHQQPQIRTQLSFILEGVISQQLLPRIGGGRAMAAEILVPTSAIRNLIREDKIHQLYSQMQMGQGETGMKTMNQSLVALVHAGSVTWEDAYSRSTNPEEFKKICPPGSSGATTPSQSRRKSILG